MCLVVLDVADGPTGCEGALDIVILATSTGCKGELGIADAPAGC